MSVEHNSRILIGVTSDRSLRFHLDLARGLVAHGYEVNLVADPGEYLDELSSEFQVHRVPMERQPHMIKDFLSLIKWIQLIRSLRPKLILVGTPKASLLGNVAGAVLRVKHRIYYVQGLRLETATGVLRLVLRVLEWLTLTLATDSIAVSHSLRSELIRLGLVRSARVNVLGKGGSKGVNLEKFQFSNQSHPDPQLYLDLGFDPSLPTIGFVGRIIREKGIVEYKDALIQLRQWDFKFQTVLLGSSEDGVGQACIEEIRNAGIPIIAPGKVVDTTPFYRLMDVFCLPTYREGLPNVLLEAFASGVPVVSTRVTGVIDLVDDGKTGLLVRPRDSEELAHAIKRLLDNPSLATELSATARRFVEEEFDSTVVNQRKINYIMKLLNSG